MTKQSDSGEPNRPRTEESGLAKPNTAAGRARLARFTEWAGDHAELIQHELDTILAIEAEASAEPLRLLRELVEAIPQGDRIARVAAARRYLADR